MVGSNMAFLVHFLYTVITEACESSVRKDCQTGFILQSTLEF